MTATTYDGRTTTANVPFSTSNSGAGTVYEIVNKLSAKVLDVTGASTTDGAIIQQWDFNGGGQQKWTIVPVESPYFIIVNQLSGKVLDITGVSTSDGAIIQQYDYLGGDNQKWQFVPSGDGYFTIVSKLDGKVLDDTGVATTNGSYIQQWDSLGGDNQQWHLALDGTIPIVQGTSEYGFAESSDGSVSGLSVLSISGGNATTFSETELDYTASFYYDPYTAAYLFDNATNVASVGAISSGVGAAYGALSAPTLPWHGYQLQTNHYAVAFLLTSAGYYDAFGFSGGESSSDDSGDVTFDPSGLAVYVSAEYIYLGSTIAYQLYVPQDLVSTVPLSDKDNTVYVPPSGIPIFTTSVTLQSGLARQVLALVVAAEAADAASNGSVQDANPVPAILQVVADAKCVNVPWGYCFTANTRSRKYLVLDSFGHPFNLAHTVRIDETLVYVAGNQSRMPLPNENGWSTVSGNRDLSADEGLVDNYALLGAGNGDFILELQSYYASLFQGPPELSLPSVPLLGYAANEVPLLIYSPFNPQSGKQGCTYYSSQLVQLNFNGNQRINGDSGPPNSNNVCKSPTP